LPVENIYSDESHSGKVEWGGNSTSLWRHPNLYCCTVRAVWS